MMKAMTCRLVLLAILIALLGAACSPAAQQPTAAPAPTLDASEITAEGRLEPVRYAQLALNTDGSLRDLFKQQGEKVQAGDVILTVQAAQGQSLAQAQTAAALELADAYQALKQAQQALDDFYVPGMFGGQSAEGAARSSLAAWNAAREAFEPYRAMERQSLERNKYFATLPRRITVDTGEYPKEAQEYKKRLEATWVDYRKALIWLDLQSAVESAQARVAQAQQDYEGLQDPSLAEDTAGARAALATAELRAPFSGTITDLDLKVGQALSAGTPIVTVADFSRWVVKTTNLTEIDVVNVQEGQPVTLTLDALPGVTLKGAVQSIGRNYTERQGDIVYEATIVLSDSVPGMRWGMTAQAKFEQ